MAHRIGSPVAHNLIGHNNFPISGILERLKPVANVPGDIAVFPLAEISRKFGRVVNFVIPLTVALGR